MGKSAKLAAKPKRRRRPTQTPSAHSNDQRAGAKQPAANAASVNSPPAVDVPRIIIRSILDGPKGEGSLRDQSIIQALQSLAAGKTTEDPKAISLAKRLKKQQAREQLTDDQFSNAVGEVLTITRQNSSPDHPNRLMELLALLAG